MDYRTVIGVVWFLIYWTSLYFIIGHVLDTGFETERPQLVLTIILPISIYLAVAVYELGRLLLGSLCDYYDLKQGNHL